MICLEFSLNKSLICLSSFIKHRELEFINIQLDFEMSKVRVLIELEKNFDELNLNPSKFSSARLIYTSKSRAYDHNQELGIRYFN